jgi:twinkle protein
LLVDKDKIVEAKEKLGDSNAEIIANELGLQNYDAKNKKSCCPYHSEDTPSFIYNSKNYNFHCFGCQKNVDIIDVFMEKGATYIEAVEKLFDLAGMPHSFGEKHVRTKTSYHYPKSVDCSNKDKVYEYFQTRGISKETIDYCDVRQDENGNAVFNYYDTNDVLTMVKYRPSHKINRGENKTWCQKGADTTPLLFNMNRINTSKPLLITEGEADTMAAIESGYINSVSVPLGAGNFHWIEECWDWLEQFDSIIICSDNDEPGIKMQKEVVYRLGSWRCKTVNIPLSFKKEDGVRIKVKDLNEVLYYWGKEKVIELILCATDTPVDSVLDFSDIKNIDLDNIDGIYTGFKDLDRKLMKLFYGSFNIVTGVNGSGKSSFLSQIICQSLEQNKNVWMYSGELPNFQSKNWINYILAGQRNVVEKQVNGTEFWKVTNQAQYQMNKHYKGKLYIYKDGYSHKVPDLLKSMIDSIRKYGAKLVVIDNLTSVNLEANEKNRWNKQEEFVTQCIDIAKKYNVAVILVCHPHKIETMRRLSKMDIQGISSIIDLAHRIISLYRVTAEDKQGEPKQNNKGWKKKPIKYDVLVDILKDRMLGYEGSTVGLYYDRPSRRFFTNESDLDYKYSWDRNEYSTPLPFPPIQLSEINQENEVFGNTQL